MIKKFGDFQHEDHFSKKIMIIGETHDLTDLYGDEASPISIEIKPNAYSTHQAFNQLPASKFLPTRVNTKFSAQRLKSPISVVSPDSTIRTFPSFRSLNQTPLAKGSVYFTRPKFGDQIQIAAYNGNIVSARQIVDGEPVYLDMDRFPERERLQKMVTQLHEKFGESLIRFRAGLTSRGPILLMMENFKLMRPDLVNLYFSAYESNLGKLPDWYKHKINSGLVNAYLNEYINREAVSKRCPYLL